MSDIDRITERIKILAGTTNDDARETALQVVVEGADQVVTLLNAMTIDRIRSPLYGFAHNLVISQLGNINLCEALHGPEDSRRETEKRARVTALIVGAMKSILKEEIASQPAENPEMAKQTKSRVENRASMQPKKKELRLDETGLFIDGKHHRLTPNALAMWKSFFEVKGEALHQADFPGFEPRKVINDLPAAVAKLISHGRPHQGYSIPRLQKQFRK